MKCLMYALLLAILGLVARAETFLLISPKTAEDIVVERVATWMETNLHFEVRSLRLDAWEGTNAMQQATALARHMTTNDLAMVVLTDRLPKERHAEMLRDVPVGFINMEILRTENQETYVRRLERQAMRIVGFKFGLSPTPMPFCALAPYGDLQQLDRMGRGFSPPAMAAYRRALEKSGVTLPEAAKRLLPATSIPRMPALPIPVAPSPKQPIGK